MTPTTNGATPEDASSVGKAIHLVQVFAESDDLGIGVSDLARRAGLSKSTTFRLLTTLQEHGAVEKVGHRYLLGHALRELRDRAHVPEDDRLRELLTPHVAELFRATARTVHLAVLRGDDVLYLNTLHGRRRVWSPVRIGARVPAHATSVGKLLLAYEDRDAASAATPLRGFTPRTVVDPSRLEVELGRIRRTGVAHDHGELEPDLVCVAGAVLGPDGRPVAALSVAGHASSFVPAAVVSRLRQVCAAAGRDTTIALRQARGAVAQHRRPIAG